MIVPSLTHVGSHQKAGVSQSTPSTNGSVISSVFSIASEIHVGDHVGDDDLQPMACYCPLEKQGEAGACRDIFYHRRQERAAASVAMSSPRTRFLLFRAWPLHPLASSASDNQVSVSFYPYLALSLCLLGGSSSDIGSSSLLRQTTIWIDPGHRAPRPSRAVHHVKAFPGW